MRRLVIGNLSFVPIEYMDVKKKLDSGVVPYYKLLASWNSASSYMCDSIEWD